MQCVLIVQEAKLLLDSHEMMASSNPEARHKMTNPIQNVIALTVENGGGTFEQGTYLPFNPDDGYAVAVGGVVLPLEDATLESVTRWAKAVTTEHQASFLGTWINGGQLYLDAVTYVKSLRDAILVGLRYRQIAVYSFADQRSINLDKENS